MILGDQDILKRTVRFLAQPELVIHECPTSEDQEATKILEEILVMYGDGEELKIIKWGPERVEWVLPDRLPAVRTVGGIFHGLHEIKKFAAIERDDWKNVEAYGT